VASRTSSRSSRSGAGPFLGSNGEVQSPVVCWERVRTRTEEDWDQLRGRIASQGSGPDVEICLVRHGETTTNAKGLVTGTTDAPLTQRGRDQANAAGRALAGREFTLAFSSHLQRSRETLSLILEAGALRVGGIFIDPRLAERSLGQMELTEAKHVDAYARGDMDYAPPGGDSYLTVAHRCVSFLLDLRELAAVVGHPLSLLVCTHVGPMRVFAGIITRMGDPASVLALHFDNSEPACLQVSCVEVPGFMDARRIRVDAP
jgi:broad specificity phosphatase PhoE